MPANEGDCAVNPLRRNFLKYLLCKRFVLSFSFSISENVFHLDLLDSFLVINPSGNFSSNMI